MHNIETDAFFYFTYIEIDAFSLTNGEFRYIINPSEEVG